ncbi:tRNA (guanosine(46)-N7)-methyltransferase TrmB [Oceanobacillus caeni]|uniref:tRNA (guanosine(46)-N7)-methyltransferase TrmB n=1 Tax=Bacillaceae TaxID=186817 RepID=UPI000621B4C3|nr:MULTISPECIES: tRNA (guanosine(46)-N7)-methyltransferase TrmB [Bacillaceae]KKE79965.1 tRNA (guanine-N7)-methyltransferase [Bacilli bacterium VT-13-104]PZD83001.1 tRNA (guanosine(46)-N7)-methyltransferase TrmB [Bacilli bacterium]MBU8792427.1 tRNA (guanosine(46)-N7)-methyltransferase TrmB [Oceanobacillus caeni]MCR1835332.1 tRNA (guanosine(46)-N7)-methyltransferase TrmB [Oceanobacillus caeni]MED4474315.1 tRNA (guanosine(46)-N7)-methyltransferase TrmB [Oceanobacillus caeni]
MRQRNKPWADDFLKENTQLIIPNPSAYKGKWSTLFGNNNPIHVEVGTGKGQFIVGMAKQYPNINFIGIELAKSIVVTAAQKVLEAGSSNVLLLNENAGDLVEIFAENEVSTIYLNFSDPWPKNRHEKRRLTYKAFLDQYKTILKQSGQVIFKTDNRGLFEYSLVSVTDYNMKLEEVNLDLHAIQDESNIMTEYEERFSAKGQPIYRLKASF